MTTWRKILAWHTPPRIKIGDKVRIIAPLEKLHMIHINEDYNNWLDVNDIHTVVALRKGALPEEWGHYSDNSFVAIRPPTKSSALYIPYHFWEEFLEVVNTPEDNSI